MEEGGVLTTKMANSIVARHQKGEVSDEFLKVFAISGTFPEPEEFQEMTLNERNDFWSSRIEKNLGPNWREILGAMSNCFVKPSNQNWLLEGF